MLVGGGTSCLFGSEGSLLQERSEHPIEILDFSARYQSMIKLIKRIQMKEKWIKFANYSLHITRMEIDRRAMILARNYNELLEIRTQNIFNKWVQRYRWINFKRKILSRERIEILEDAATTIPQYKQDKMRKKWMKFAFEITHDARIDTFIEKSDKIIYKSLLKSSFATWEKECEKQKAQRLIQHENWLNFTEALENLDYKRNITQAAKHISQRRKWIYLTQNLKIIHIESSLNKLTKNDDWLYLVYEYVHKVQLDRFIEEKERLSRRRLWNKFVKYQTAVSQQIALKRGLEKTKIIKKFQKLGSRAIRKAYLKDVEIAKSELDIENENIRLHALSHELFYRWRKEAESHSINSNLLREMFDSSVSVHTEKCQKAAATQIQRWYRNQMDRKENEKHIKRRYFIKWTGLSSQLLRTAIRFPRRSLIMTMGPPPLFGIKGMRCITGTTQTLGSISYAVKAKRRHSESTIQRTADLVTDTIKLSIPENLFAQNIDAIDLASRHSRDARLRQKRTERRASDISSLISFSMPSFELDFLSKSTKHVETDLKPVKAPKVRPIIIDRTAYGAAKRTPLKLKPILGAIRQKISPFNTDQLSAHPKPRIAKTAFGMSLAYSRELSRSLNLQPSFSKALFSFGSFDAESVFELESVSRDCASSFDQNFDFEFKFNLQSIKAIEPKYRPNPTFTDQFLEDATMDISLRNDFASPTIQRKAAPILAAERPRLDFHGGTVPNEVALEITDIRFELPRDRALEVFEKPPKTPFPYDVNYLEITPNDLQIKTLDSLLNVYPIGKQTQSMPKRFSVPIDLPAFDFINGKTNISEFERVPIEEPKLDRISDFENINLDLLFNENRAEIFNPGKDYRDIIEERIYEISVEASNLIDLFVPAVELPNSLSRIRQFEKPNLPSLPDFDDIFDEPEFVCEIRKLNVNQYIKPHQRPTEKEMKELLLPEMPSLETLVRINIRNESIWNGMNRILDKYTENVKVDIPSDFDFDFNFIDNSCLEALEHKEKPSIENIVEEICDQIEVPFSIPNLTPRVNIYFEPIGIDPNDVSFVNYDIEFPLHSDINFQRSPISVYEKAEIPELDSTEIDETFIIPSLWVFAPHFHSVIPRPVDPLEMQTLSEDVNGASNSFRKVLDSDLDLICSIRKENSLLRFETVGIPENRAEDEAADLVNIWFSFDNDFIPAVRIEQTEYVEIPDQFDRLFEEDKEYIQIKPFEPKHTEMKAENLEHIEQVGDLSGLYNKQSEEFAKEYSVDPPSFSEFAPDPILAPMPVSKSIPKQKIETELIESFEPDTRYIPRPNIKSLQNITHTDIPHHVLDEIFEGDDRLEFARLTMISPKIVRKTRPLLNVAKPVKAGVNELDVTEMASSYNLPIPSLSPLRPKPVPIFKGRLSTPKPKVIPAHYNGYMSGSLFLDSLRFETMRALNSLGPIDVPQHRFNELFGESHQYIEIVEFEPNAHKERPLFNYTSKEEQSFIAKDSESAASEYQIELTDFSEIVKVPTVSYRKTKPRLSLPKSIYRSFEPCSFELEFSLIDIRGLKSLEFKDIPCYVFDELFAEDNEYFTPKPIPIPDYYERTKSLSEFGRGEDYSFSPSFEEDCLSAEYEFEEPSLEFNFSQRRSLLSFGPKDIPDPDLFFSQIVIEYRKSLVFDFDIIKNVLTHFVPYIMKQRSLRNLYKTIEMPSFSAFASQNALLRLLPGPIREIIPSDVKVLYEPPKPLMNELKRVDIDAVLRHVPRQPRPSRIRDSYVSARGYVMFLRSGLPKQDVCVITKPLVIAQSKPSTPLGLADSVSSLIKIDLSIPAEIPSFKKVHIDKVETPNLIDKYDDRNLYDLSIGYNLSVSNSLLHAESHERLPTAEEISNDIEVDIEFGTESLFLLTERKLPIAHFIPDTDPFEQLVDTLDFGLTLKGDLTHLPLIKPVHITPPAEPDYDHILESCGLNLEDMLVEFDPLLNISPLLNITKVDFPINVNLDRIESYLGSPIEELCIKPPLLSLRFLAPDRTSMITKRAITRERSMKRLETELEDLIVKFFEDEVEAYVSDEIPLIVESTDIFLVSAEIDDALEVCMVKFGTNIIVKTLDVFDNAQYLPDRKEQKISPKPKPQAFDPSSVVSSISREVTKASERHAKETIEESVEIKFPFVEETELELVNAQIESIIDYEFWGNVDDSILDSMQSLIDVRTIWDDKDEEVRPKKNPNRPHVTFPGLDLSNGYPEDREECTIDSLDGDEDLLEEEAIEQMPAPPFDPLEMKEEEESFEEEIDDKLQHLLFPPMNSDDKRKDSLSSSEDDSEEEPPVTRLPPVLLGRLPPPPPHVLDSESDYEEEEDQSFLDYLTNDDSSESDKAPTLEEIKAIVEEEEERYEYEYDYSVSSVGSPPPQRSYEEEEEEDKPPKPQKNRPYVTFPGLDLSHGYPEDHLPVSGFDNSDEYYDDSDNEVETMLPEDHDHEYDDPSEYDYEVETMLPEDHEEEDIDDAPTTPVKAPEVLVPSTPPSTPTPLSILVPDEVARKYDAKNQLPSPPPLNTGIGNSEYDYEYDSLIPDNSGYSGEEDEERLPPLQSLGQRLRLPPPPRFIQMGKDESDYYSDDEPMTLFGED